MQNDTNKKALLVVSFGTSYETTRQVTIDAIETDLAAAYPDRKLYRGWTSRMIVKILRKRGIHFDTLEEAVERMRRDGITDVLVQPTHIISGGENDRMLKILQENAAFFDHITVGRPLLDTEEDRRELAQILASELLPESASSGLCSLVLMGHGSSDKQEANRIYPLMEQAFRKSGHDNVFVGTVEGEPTVEDILNALGPAKDPSHTVYLTPMMIVAGDHANNDMAGEEDDSWKNRIAALGYRVVPILKGLGEYPKVRNMICRHAAEAEKLR